MNFISSNPQEPPKFNLNMGLHTDSVEEGPTLRSKMLKYADSPKKKPQDHYFDQIQSLEEIIINPIKRPEQVSKSDSYNVVLTPKLSHYDPLKFCPLCKHLDPLEDYFWEPGANREIFRDHDSGSVQDFNQIVITEDSEEEEAESHAIHGNMTSQSPVKKHASNDEYMFPSLKKTNMNER
jgi:hypothetical protein